MQQVIQRRRFCEAKQGQTVGLCLAEIPDSVKAEQSFALFCEAKLQTEFTSVEDRNS
jgi:hypothetical protein